MTTTSMPSGQNYMNLRPKDMMDYISLCFEVNTPAMIWGPPGVGKTSLVEKFAKLRGVTCLTVALTLFDPVDLRGLPIVDRETNTVKWVPLGELPTEGEGIINFDEINTADPAVMAAAMRLILTGKLGEYTLPPGWRKFATGNRIEDGASANKMPTALADRFDHVELSVHAEDWADWANDNGVPAQTIAFVLFRKDLLHDFDKARTVNTTPRGWADVGKVVSRDPGLSSMASLAYVSGRVGEGTAQVYRSFVRVWQDLPNIDDILTGKDLTSCDEMDNPAVKYAVSMALSASIEGKEGQIKNACAYLDRIGQEFTKMALLAAMRRDSRLQSNTEYLRWITSGQARIGGGQKAA